MKRRYYEKERPIECPKHGNPLTSFATHMSNFQKDYQGLMEQLNVIPTAAPIKKYYNEDINSKVDKLIDKTSNYQAKSLLPLT